METAEVVMEMEAVEFVSLVDNNVVLAATEVEVRYFRGESA